MQAQAILWDTRTLAALTVGTPDWRKEPPACAWPALPPLSVVEPEPYEPTIAEITYTLRWLRDWRYALSQQANAAAMKRLLDLLDHRAGEVAGLLWQQWQDERPAWKRAS